MVTINSGAPEPTDKFEDTPRNKWKTLLNVRRSFIATSINYDCRCLIDFCEEAKLVYSELGFSSAEGMIREGYDLEPCKVELAVAWLRDNGMDRPVPMAEAIEPIAKHGGDRKSEDYQVDNINLKTKGGTDTEYTLRRLARDAPEMLDKIESGELSVNAAAIQAGIRKKPKPEEVCVKAFRKTDNRLEAIKMIVSELKEHERQMLIEILQGATP